MISYTLIFFLLVAAVSCLQNKYCQLSCDFGTKTVSHVVCERQFQKCGPGPKCGPDFKVVPMTDQLRQVILDTHNFLRNKVASGEERRGNQPSATNMNVMTYNKELEYVAQCWANTCSGNPLIHDNCRRTEKYSHIGQNLAVANSSNPIVDVKGRIKELIMLWYNEVAIFNRNWVKDTRDRGPAYKVGHYTQMLWSDTSELGCAAAYYTTEYQRKWHQVVLVCNYGPGGNYLGWPAYEEGEPASNCPDNQPANNRYRSLCGISKKVSDVKKIHDIFKF